MTTLITGGTGLVGDAVAEHLLARGEPVVSLDVREREEPDGLTSVVADVADTHAVADVVETHDPDRIVHLAAIVGRPTNRRPTEGLQVNAVGTDNVFRAAAAHGVERVAYASTLGVYGPARSYDGDTVDEETVPPAAFTVYPESSFYRALKQLNEYQGRMYANEHGLDCVAVRPSVVFGPRRDRGWIGSVVEDALREGEATVARPPEARLSLVYMTDVADLFVTLLDADAPAHHVYNSGGQSVTAREVAEVVAAETGATVTCDEEAPPKASPAVIDNHRAVEEFGLELTPLDEAVADYVERLS